MRTNSLLRKIASSVSQLLILPVVLVYFLSCSPEPPSVDLESEIAALTQADQYYTQLATNKNSEGIIGLYTDDAVIYPLNGDAVNGLEEVTRFVDEFTSIPKLDFKHHEPLAIEVSKGGDMGYTINMVELTIPDSLGNPVTMALRDVHLWRKDDTGSWKVMVDIWNAE